MQIDRPNRRRLRRASAALLTYAVAAALEISGCGKSDSDPSAAPYGTSASASPAAATLTGGNTSAAPPSLPSGQSGASAATPPTDPVGPDTKTPAVAPPAAPPGLDSGSDVKAPPMSGGGPMMGMGSSATAPLTPTPELDAKVAAAEKSGNKTEIGNAYAIRGTFRMNDANAGAKVKYRAALDDYRKALKADPANPEAKQNKDLIEGIYKQMGRPIPGA